MLTLSDMPDEKPLWARSISWSEWASLDTDGPISDEVRRECHRRDRAAERAEREAAPAPRYVDPNQLSLSF